MARASVVIGLGGTGQWVLTYLKNDLIEANNGEMPEHVQLLGVDTQSPDVQLLRAGGNVEGDSRMATLTDAQVGTVRLDKIDEFFQIGEELYDFVLSKHNQNPKPEEFSWLDTDLFINAGANVCNTIYGAGAYRQLGRLSLFNKADLFYNRLQQVITRGQNAIQNRMMTYGGGNQPERLEVVLVSSLAGGTGAGIFLDVAWLIRAAAKSLNLANYQLTGYFVMPTAWEQAGPATDKRLRSYAAWQELNRFMLPPVNVNNPTEILYKPDANSPIKGIYDRRIFDVAYIIDPDRTTGGNLQQLKPEDGTYPVVAQAISGLLDDSLGQMISLDNSNNNTRIITLPRAVYYTSVGAFTFKTPEHFSKSQVLNEYRMAVLEQLIAPNFGPSGEAIGVRKDRNTEAAPSTVEHGAGKFLSSGQHNNLNNNALLPEIQIVSAKGEDLPKHVIDEANRIVKRSGETFKALTTKVNDVDLQQKLDQLVNENIWHVVRPSGDRTNATPRGIKQEVLNGVEAKDVEWFGQWGYIPDPRNPTIQIQTRITEGTKVRLLREAGNAIVKNFKVLLKGWSAVQLNGIVNDAVRAKSGKLGYLLGVYEELDNKFDAYLSYLNLLYQRLLYAGYRVKFTEARDLARKKYDLLAGKECIFAFFDNNVHPHARDAERNYLRAANNLFQYYLSESIITGLAETVRAMQQFTKESKDKLDDWVKVLAIGKLDGDPNQRFTSLYNYGRGIIHDNIHALYEEIRRGNPNFVTDRELRGVQQVLNVQIANNHYQSNDRLAVLSQRDPQPVPYQVTNEIKSGLDAFVWSVGHPAGGTSLEFGLGILGTNNAIAPLSVAQTHNAVMENYSMLNKELNDRFNQAQNQWVDTPIIDVLSYTFQNVQTFAQQLKLLSSPLYKQRQGAGIVYQQNRMFMRLDGSTNAQYFNDLENEVRKQLVGAKETINPLNNNGNYSTTSDPYKFTFLQFHHHIPSADFVLLNDLERLFRDTMAQRNQIVSPSVHYTYNAERKAHDLALSRVKQNKVSFKPFGPEVVALLENPEKTKLFFLAYAQELLKYDDGNDKKNTTVKLLGKEEINEVFLYDTDETAIPVYKKLTMYEAINYWLVGKDARPQMQNINLVDWDKLGSIIRAEELGPGMTNVIEAYRDHMDETNPASLVSIIRSQANARRSAVVGVNNQRYYQENMFDDLIDLAKVIYTERVQHLENAQ